MRFLKSSLSVLSLSLLVLLPPSCVGTETSPAETQERSTSFELPQAVPAGAQLEEDQNSMPEVVGSGLYGLKTTTLEGEPLNLARFQGKVVLVVNIATRSAYAPQIDALEDLRKDFAGKGFEVLAFPCNDFGREEPGTVSEIRSKLEGRVQYPVLEKVRARVGHGQSSVYSWLGNQAGTLPTWNFSKYLIGRDGEVLRYFSSDVEPSSVELRTAISAALQGVEQP